MSQSEPIQILVVDDEQSIRRLLEKELASERRMITTVDCAKEAFRQLRHNRYDVIILDIQLPDGNGIDLMVKFRDIYPESEVILVTGYGNIDNAVEAMKMGAYDYITKPFNLDRLELVVEKAYQRVCLQRENRLLKHNQGDEPLHKLIGNCPTMEQVRYLISKVAPTHVPVLITGESGTGKNVVSRSIHKQSVRSGQPLITKNCGTLQKELIRSELFGYRKGSFTGATESRDGLLSLAHKGTLFLDEIGELPMEVQASMLRVLENQTYRRVGEQEERQVDVRFIFATNRELQKEVAAGRFSQALYHRLNVFNIELPALRERKEDIPLLVEYFRQKLSLAEPCRISRRAMECLMAYHWPGNIRELQNVIERGVILAENGLITERALPRELMASVQEPLRHKSPFASLAEMEREQIFRVLSYVEGNRVKAAEILGIGRKTLYRKLKSYEDEEIEAQMN